MKVLLTGANGYLGQGIVKCLLDYGHEVIATDISSNKIDKRATIKECDLFQVENPYEFFCKPDVLLHLAWREGFVHYSDAHIIDLYKHYEFIKKLSQSKIKKIAVMGTMHEVGVFEGSINEDTPCNPLTPYGIAKNSLRQLTEMICSQNDIRFQWLRGFYIVGNNKYGSSIFSKITYAEENKEDLFPFTTGRNQYDFIDYKDFCEQVAKTICQDKILGIINICSGYPEKLSDRVERFIKENNYHIKLRYGVFPDRPYDSKAVWGDNKKITEIMLNSKKMGE